MKNTFTLKTAKNTCIDDVAQPLVAASKLIAALALVLVFGIGRSYAQAPNISYSSPQVYNPFIPITALSPANTGGVVPPSAPVAQVTANAAILCMAVDSTRSFYVGTSGSGAITRITGNVKVFLGSGLVNPSGVAVDPSGNVFVADYGHNAIKEILVSNGSTNTLLSAGSPKGMGLDAQGTIYFCVGTGVYKLPKGATTRLMVASGFSNPVSVAVDATGNVYVADPGAGTITKVLASNGSKIILATVGNGLTGVAVDSHNNIYYSDTNSAIMVMLAAGGPLMPVCSTLVGHKIIAVDKSGNVFTDNGLTVDLVPFGNYTVNPILPGGLNIDHSTGIISGTPLRVTAAANYTVTAYNNAGHGAAVVNIAVAAPVKPNISYSTPQTFTVGASVSISPVNTGGVVPTPQSAAIATGITSFIWGVAVDASGNIYASTQGGTAITKYSPGGGTSVNIGSGFQTPTGIALDASGNLYVVDNGNGAIKEVLASNGSIVTLATVPQYETAGIAVAASGNIYLSSGEQILKVPAGGGTPIVLLKGLLNPIGIAVDASENIYFVNNSGGTLRELPAGSSTSIVLATGFKNPVGVAFDPAGNLYVGDAGEHVVKKIPFGGGTPITITTTFNSPGSIATDASGNIYVGDSGNQAIYEANPGYYYLTPALPAGLNIDPGTGIISGTATAASPTTNYTISTHNAGGYSVATVEITVNPVPSPAISYVSPQIYAVNTAIQPLTPTTDISFNSHNLAVINATTFASGLAGCRGITTDASGNVYVAEFSGNAVIKISAVGGTVTTLASINGPSDVALDAAGNVYVAASSGVYKITTGGTLTELGTGIFQQPRYISIDGYGNIYILDKTADVYEIPAGSTTPAKQAHLYYTLGLKCDKYGNWFIFDDYAQSIYEVPVSNRAQTIPIVSGLNYGLTIAIDQGGNIYFGAQDGLYEITPGFAPVKIYAISGYCTVDATGNLLVSQASSGKIFKTSRQTGFFISRALPVGLNFNGTTGVISGTPTVTSPATNYTVTGYNTVGSASATVNIATVGGTNTSLTNLAVSSGTLSPAFATATTNYTVSEPHTTSSITITPTAGGGTASILVNGVAVASGTASAAVPLAVGANTITVSVTDNGGTTVSNYTITVSRIGSTALANFAISPGTISPAFSSGTYSYSTTLPAGAGFISITPTLVDSTSTITVNGKGVASGTTSPQIQLAVGANTINTVVTAADGVTTQTYTLTATRPSANAYLSALHLSKGTISPAFNSSNYSYSDAVANSATSIAATPTTLDPGATVTVNGTAVTSGTASASISLNVGANTLTVAVTAADGVTTKTYTVTVTRAGASNANLSAFTVSRGALTPAFSTNTTSYTANVVNGVTSMTVTPTTADATATVKVNGTTVTSGSPSGPIALSIGSNTITTIVTAQDGTTTKTYTLTVTRASGPIANYDPGSSFAQLTEAPAVADDGIIVHQALSPNGDGINDFLTIENIAKYPDNKLSIINRNGQLVYEAKGYDNSTRVFDGRSNKTGQKQLPGTYFYQLDYTISGVTKHKTGYLVLKY